MKVRELADQCIELERNGHGDDDVFLSGDDEGNSFRPLNDVALYTVEAMEREDMWIEEPRPDGADHVVLW